jgi:transposase
MRSSRTTKVDPNAWLTQTLERIAAGWPNKDIDALMPWNFAET